MGFQGFLASIFVDASPITCVVLLCIFILCVVGVVCGIPASALVLQCASVFGSSSDQVNNFRDTTCKDGLESNGNNNKGRPAFNYLSLVVEF